MNSDVISTKETSEIGVLKRLDKFGHEQVLFCQDKETGLKAIIAIHSTVLGPSLGGTRMWNYASEDEALTDVLRLSRGMTYKSAISGLNLGGGKAIIIGDSRTMKSEALFRRFGQFVDSLNGKYITAEDVGITIEDIKWVAQETKHVAGKPVEMGGSGDPSPVTAKGVYYGMKAAAKFVYGSDSLKDRKVAVQGVGHVGSFLVDYLAEEGAIITITDIHDDLIEQIQSKHEVTVVSPDDIYDVEMDIYAPCALGGTLNDETIRRLKCKIVAGAANNQLKDEERHGQMILEQGIVYAPDFLINAGGIINCYAEVNDVADDFAEVETKNIYNTTLAILEKSKKENIPSFVAASMMAEDRIEKARKAKNKEC
ncbi:MAG: leucine dehydrogenase [Patiriisocius sp.]|jgi:leucine dehydrogenase